MDNSTKGALKLLALVLVVGGALIGLCVGLSTAALNATRYQLHYNNAISAHKWSYGTLNDAKRVVTQLIKQSDEPGEIKLSLGTLRAWETDQGWGFDTYDIVTDYCYMLLPKKDYFAYCAWLEELSKPYAKGEKVLTPPYLPPPWDALK